MTNQKAIRKGVINQKVILSILHFQMGTANQKSQLPIIYFRQETTGAFDRTIVPVLSCHEVETWRPMQVRTPGPPRDFSATQSRSAECTPFLSSRCLFRVCCLRVGQKPSAVTAHQRGRSLQEPRWGRRHGQSGQPGWPWKLWSSYKYNFQL